MIFDRAALTNILQPLSWLAYLTIQVNQWCWFGVVWNRFCFVNLKTQTKINCGSGVSWKVTANVKLHNNRDTFLCCAGNKKDPFAFLGHTCINNSHPNTVCITIVEEGIKPNEQVCLQDLKPYNIEEAENCMLLQALHALQNLQKITIKTLSSDAVVTAVGDSSKRLKSTEFCISFDTAKTMQYIPRHERVAPTAFINAQAFTKFGMLCEKFLIYL